MANLSEIKKSSFSGYDDMLADSNISSTAIYLLGDKNATINPMREKCLWRSSSQGQMGNASFVMEDSSQYKYLLIIYDYTYGTNSYGMKVDKVLNPYYIGAEAGTIRKRHSYLTYFYSKTVATRIIRFDSPTSFYATSAYNRTKGNSGSSATSYSCSVWEIWGVNNF